MPNFISTGLLRGKNTPHLAIFSTSAFCESASKWHRNKVKCGCKMILKPFFIFTVQLYASVVYALVMSVCPSICLSIHPSNRPSGQGGHGHMTSLNFGK